jgi:hypothetical protein
MKSQISIIAILSVITLCRCEEDDLCLIGSGNVNTYEIEAASFEAVNIFGPVNLRYTQGSTTEVSVTCEPEMYHHLDSHISDQTLYIGYRENITCFETDHEVWVNITHPDLSTIEADGVNEIVTTAPIAQPSINIDASGKVKVSLSGQVDEQILTVSGALQVRNFDLQSRHTQIDVSGSSEMEISCSETLEVDVSGSSTIYYKGHPDINRTVDGSLSLHDAN